jgi:hypothetical protein
LRFYTSRCDELSPTKVVVEVVVCLHQIRRRDRAARIPNTRSVCSPAETSGCLVPGIEFTFTSAQWTGSAGQWSPILPRRA